VAEVIRTPLDLGAEDREKSILPRIVPPLPWRNVETHQRAIHGVDLAALALAVRRRPHLLEPILLATAALGTPDQTEPPQLRGRPTVDSRPMQPTRSS
jgi:hypothetical protein